MFGFSETAESSFKDNVLNSRRPVLVVFWASWARPCETLAPVLRELSREYGDKIKFTSVNTDENQSLSKQYGINAVPTIAMFAEGRKIDTMIGAVPLKSLQNFCQLEQLTRY